MEEKTDTAKGVGILKKFLGGMAKKTVEAVSTSHQRIFIDIPNEILLKYLPQMLEEMNEVEEDS